MVWTARRQLSRVQTLVSLSLRLKDLLGPVTRVKKKKKKRSETFGRAPKLDRVEPPVSGGGWLLSKHMGRVMGGVVDSRVARGGADGSEEGSYFRLIDGCITQL